MLVFTVIPLAKCTPLSANWDMYDPTHTKPYKCITDRVTWPVAAAISAATDLAAVVIPLAILNGLRKPMKQKIGLYSVFAVGLMYVWLSIQPSAANTDPNTQCCRSWHSQDSSRFFVGPRASRLYLYVYNPLVLPLLSSENFVD